MSFFDNLERIVLACCLDRLKVLVRHFTWCGVKWPRDPISNVRKETERPRSSRSPTSRSYSGFPDFLLLAACRASWVLVGIMSSKRLTDKSSIRTMSGLAW